MRISWRSLLLLALIVALVLGKGEAPSGPAHGAQGGHTMGPQGRATEPAGYLAFLQGDLPLLPDFILTEALQPQQVNSVMPLSRGGEGVKVGIIDSFAGFHRLLGGGLVATVVDGDVRAVLGQADSDGSADPSAPSGDERDPTCE